MYCVDNERGGMVPVGELVEALAHVPTREGLLVLDGFGAPNDVHSQTEVEALCTLMRVWLAELCTLSQHHAHNALCVGDRIMDNTAFSIMAPFFRLKSPEDTSLYDEDPRLDVAAFRRKRAAADQRQSDRQNFIIGALAAAVQHTAREPINSLEELSNCLRQRVATVDRECLFAHLPSSLTLFPVNVKNLHAVIVSPGLDTVERTEELRGSLMGHAGCVCVVGTADVCA